MPGAKGNKGFLGYPGPKGQRGPIGKKLSVLGGTSHVAQKKASWMGTMTLQSMWKERKKNIL